jgi:acylphosphatase
MLCYHLDSCCDNVNNGVIRIAAQSENMQLKAFIRDTFNGRVSQISLTGSNNVDRAMW